MSLIINASHSGEYSLDNGVTWITFPVGNVTIPVLGGATAKLRSSNMSHIKFLGSNYRDIDITKGVSLTSAEDMCFESYELLSVSVDGDNITNFDNTFNDCENLKCIRKINTVNSTTSTDMLKWCDELVQPCPTDALLVEAVPGLNYTRKIQCPLIWNKVPAITPAAAGANFGQSTAVSSGKIVTGAPWAGVGGMAFIVSDNGNPLATLTPPDPESGSAFGYDVDIWGQNVVVGAWQDNIEGNWQGSAYIFKTDGTFVAKLIRPPLSTKDMFGYSVAINSTQVIIGTPDSNITGVGEVHIYDLLGNFIKTIVSPDAATVNNFGNRIAASDAYIAVGMYDNNGSVYLFNSSGTFLRKLVAPDAYIDDYFGDSVAISGDIVVIGAYGNDDNGSSSGSAYVFNVDGTYLFKLLATDPEASDYFGAAIDTDGIHIVVGALGEDTEGAVSGAAYIYTMLGAPVMKVDLGNNLGDSDKLTGENGVGIDNGVIALGAENDDEMGSNAGAIYIADLKVD